MLRKSGSSLLSYLRGGPARAEKQKASWPTTWPMLPNRIERSIEDEHWESLGERGPITPVEQEVFRESPEAFAGDARFVGHRGAESSEDFG